MIKDNKNSYLKKRLAKFGLSSKQSDIYLLLITNGSMRVNEIVKALSLPRSSVYEYLHGLSDIGLVERIIKGSYKQIQAYPLSALRSDIESKLDNLRELSSNIDNTDEALSKLAAGNPAGVTSVRYYENKAGARQLLWNTLKATGPVYVYSSWGRGVYVGVDFYKKFVAESDHRRISEQVIINPNPRILASISKYSGTSVSRTKQKDVRTVDKNAINIKGETFIYNNTFAQVYLKDNVITGFEIENKQFVDFQKSIFEEISKSSKPLSV